MDAPDGARLADDDVASLQRAVPPTQRIPALGWQALTQWEAEHEVVLPEPYRTFVAEIANGCPQGPPTASGLLPLGQLPDCWRHWESENWLAAEPFDGLASRTLSAPFPLTEEWQWEYDFDDQDEHAPLLHSTYLHGSLVLGSEDDERFWILIVTGPQRGRIWQLADGSAFPYPDSERFDPPPVGFLEWIQHWATGQGWWRAG